MENKKEYDVVDGRRFPIIWRKEGSELTDKCPFCGKKHRHGISKGYASVHCNAIITKSGHPYHCVSGVFTTDGIYFAREDGYIIREY